MDHARYTCSAATTAASSCGRVILPKHHTSEGLSLARSAAAMPSGPPITIHSFFTPPSRQALSCVATSSDDKILDLGPRSHTHTRVPGSGGCASKRSIPDTSQGVNLDILSLYSSKSAWAASCLNEFLAARRNHASPNCVCIIEGDCKRLWLHPLRTNLAC